MAKQGGGGTSGSARHLPAWVLILALAVAAALIAWLTVRAPRGTGLVETLSALLQELPKDEQRIGQIILDNYAEYRGNARNWSAVYFGSLFLSAFCAALAGLVIKLEWLIKNEAIKKDLAAILAMISALLITLTTVGGFQQRWSANRLAAAKMERLGYAFMSADRKAGLQGFSAQIQAISYERNEGIVAGGSDQGKTVEAEQQAPQIR